MESQPAGFGTLMSTSFAMRRDVDHIKAQTATARVQQLGTDLAILKDQDRAQYDRLRAEILHQLGE
jgi:hypothetical protein